MAEHPEQYAREELAWKDWWGYDQIGWFANQDEESRNHFLMYTYRWTEINNVNAYFEVPFRRMLSDAAVVMKREETGMKLPEKVVVYGSFQPYVGAVKNDSNSEVTRMYYIGDNTYQLSVILPYAGEYDFAVSTYGTLSATYCSDRFPRSGSSNKEIFVTTWDNSVVRFKYRFIDNEILTEVISS